MSTWIDSHCHLDPDTLGGAAGVRAVIDRASAAGVSPLICVGAGYGFASAQRAVDVAAQHPGVYATVGLHPHDASEFTEARFETLIGLAQTPGVVALGEAGLDYHYDLAPRDVQRRVLERQVAAARALDLPLIIHDRETGTDCLDIVRDGGGFDGAGVVWHCFTGGMALMHKVVAAGGYISIPGIVTFKRAAEVRDVAQAVPLDRLLVETDSPFLAPVPHRGKPNEPAYVALVGQEVARLRGVPAPDLAAATRQNTCRFFRLPTG